MTALAKHQEIIKNMLGMERARNGYLRDLQKRVA
jgi:hypothetical protein